MAQYKVLQDIEAEDKLLGPLTLRQFIYAAIVVGLGVVAWQLARVQWLLIIPFIPPIVFFGLLAAPFGRDQSSEVWLLAKIRYWVFPRKRIWNQDGLQNLVTVSAPKVVEKHRTKDFDKDEAKSRLKALAATMDSRGWAIKNVNAPGYHTAMQQGSSDRLLQLDVVPQEDLAAVKPDADVLDPNGTPLAQSIASQQTQNEQAHRQAILQKMQDISTQQKAAQANLPALPAAPVTRAAPKPAPAPVSAQPLQPVTQPQAPAILKEVKSPKPASELRPQEIAKNDDEPDEVVISLH